MERGAVVEPLHIRVEESGAAGPDLPYTVELWSPSDGETSQVVLGQLRSASLAFACYYGALREYVGCRVVLRHGAHIVATFNPPEESAG